MSFNDKVNLQVRVASSDNNYIQYAFKFISYENKVVNLNNYRIVAYFNTFRSSDIFIQERILGGYPTGSTSGTPSNTDGYTNAEFLSPGFPPRIYPIDKRYDKEIIFPLSGTAACLTAGSYFDAIVFQIRFSSGQSFISEVIGSPNYQIGLGAFANSYSYESSTSYIDNPTFVLEYNDPTNGWVKVQEYSNASTLDANTGLYPYDVIYEEQKTVGNIDRQYGWDTTYDHDGILAEYDGYVFEQQPNSAYPSGTTYVLNGSGSGNPNTKVALFKFSTASLADKVVSAAELYTFFSQSNQTVLLDCRTNNVDYTSASTWNTMSGWSGTSGILQSQLNISNGFQFQNSYIAFNLDKDLVIDWQASSAANLGLNLRYNDPDGKTGYDAPRIVALENTEYEYLPTMFVYSGPISAQEARNIRWEGSISNLWSVAGNWEGGIVPTASDFAIFDEGFSTSACVLDSDHSVRNILGTSAQYTGSINLSSNALSIYSLSAIDLSTFTFIDLQATSSTINIQASPLCNFNNGSFGSIVFLNTVILAGSFRANSINLNNNVTLNANPIYSMITINKDGTLIMGSGSTISGTIRLNLLENATMNSLGTISCIHGVVYNGSSQIRSRTYDCTVGLQLMNEFQEAHDINASSTFTSGNFVCNGIFSIFDSFGVDSYMTLDMSANDPSFEFNNGINFYNGSFVRPGLNIIFPSKVIDIYNNITLSPILSGTTNSSACTFSLKSTNALNINGHSSIPYVVNLPKLVKNEASQMNFTESTSGFAWQDIIVSGGGLINLTDNEIKAVDSIMIVGNSNTVSNLNGVLLSAHSINFIGQSSSLMNLTSNNTWSAAADHLNADFVTLLNSTASSATGYAIRSTDLGSNINWFFDTIPPIIVQTSVSPSNYSQTPITASFSIYDAGGFDPSTIAVTNGFGLLTNVSAFDPTSATFDVIISGTQRFGTIELSASDFSGNVTQFESLIFSYDYTSPNVELIVFSPPSGISNGFINLVFSANDNCILSGSHQVFTSTFNGQPTLIQNLNFSDVSNATVDIRLSSSTPITNGDLYISATDSANNTTVFYSSAFSIVAGEPQITFESNPTFKIGSTVILVSAIFDDVIGMSQTIPYTMRYNGLNIPFSTIYVNSTKTVLSAVIPSNLGAGYISVLGYNVAGVSASAIDSGYDFIPVIVFGDPVPSNISKTTITVPISAIGPFVDDADYYYVRLSGTRMPISQPTSGLLDIFGFNFEYLSFSATVSAMTDLNGDLIISAGYR